MGVEILKVLAYQVLDQIFVNYNDAKTYADALNESVENYQSMISKSHKQLKYLDTCLKNCRNDLKLLKVYPLDSKSKQLTKTYDLLSRFYWFKQKISDESLKLKQLKKNYYQKLKELKISQK